LRSDVGLGMFLLDSECHLEAAGCTFNRTPRVFMSRHNESCSLAIYNRRRFEQI
jgi:hypothetical protein